MTKDQGQLDARMNAARELLRAARSVTVLTGAGVSAESGIPTFRGADGLWQGRSAMDLASPHGFARDPAGVWEWYNQRRSWLKAARPNPGHFALVHLEDRAPEFGLITQNVDRLHQAAGSRNVVEIHGNIWEVRCTGCGETFDRTGVDLPPAPRCEKCGDWLRPAVVWFGEMLPLHAVGKAENWAKRCNVFLVVGTSAVVMPAAGLVYVAKEAGAKVIEVNLEETPATAVADVSLLGKAGEVLPVIVG